MDLHFTAEENAFRDTARTFLDTHLPPELQRKVRQHLRLAKDDYVRWHKIVAKQGWAAPAWPVEYGGTGWTSVQRHIWEDECARAGAPPILPFGVNMVAPVIMAFANAEQKAWYLPRILNCDDWWCQGYSEPGAGSDLASLKTTAERDGDDYIVNGQKTWTTLGQHADMIFCLVRTDSTVRKQEGISFLLIDMKTPGITVRPIIMLDEEHEVNEVFFDNVRVPVSNLVGQENKGWTYAKYLLGHERTGIAAVGRSKRELTFLKQLAMQQVKRGQPLLRDPAFTAKVAQLEIELMALEMTVLRVISEEGKGPGPQASMLKVRGSEIQQQLTELMVEALGPQALPFDTAFLDGATEHSSFGDDLAAPLAAYYFNYRKTSIYGGSNEIQKNIITQMILGL
ncbi:MULTISPECIES: acyl-CoA dehydrogenase family protein [unclassified Janthinobacterium]|uniref:acyl-CoA dehydrogenase family protein n=1 Tax=unclassified Janthinobacterium TaxID=2610881 RepID=UPI00160EED93|nr:MULTISPECIES: acyl-CoA dehydrogenase family protein [unclassified Janthinobacterium]MBB5368669.1 alkylation response protein AidB-like acyl-CoA dehydrogenase [Janthinobacterium sp. K2C7]MBB5381795.1 alkylation response protein AidB-like acyl-CoA dehydrogenase [Janthinobacterium sp. K2Li3]MBB5387051.1 alkylation response protein AidB-like acyl-CoA dehydrogenase [Janthinobacterium sp. K2E3]